MNSVRWLLVLATGCAVPYAYVPTTNRSVTLQGMPAAEYLLPPGAPQGSIRLLSDGIVDMASAWPAGGAEPALHLRVELTQSGSVPWSFDTREQTVQLDDYETLVPSFASASGGVSPPVVPVDRSARRIVDLFYLLPSSFRERDAIPRFDAVWRIGTDRGPISGRSRFERRAIEPWGADYEWDYGRDYYLGVTPCMNVDCPYDGLAGSW